MRYAGSWSSPNSLSASAADWRNSGSSRITSLSCPGAASSSGTTTAWPARAAAEASSSGWNVGTNTSGDLAETKCRRASLDFTTRQRARIASACSGPNSQIAQCSHAIASSPDSAWMAKTWPLMFESRCRRLLTLCCRPDKSSRGVKAGLVAPDHSSQCDLRSRVFGGTLPIRIDSQVWTAGVSSSHAAKSSASSTRTSRHRPSAIFSAAHSSFLGHRRGVTNTNVASTGSTVPPSSNRFSQLSSAFLFGGAPTLISHPEIPLGTNAVPRSAWTIPSQPGRWTPSPVRTWSLVTPTPVASIRRRITRGRTPWAFRRSAHAARSVASQSAPPGTEGRRRGFRPEVAKRFAGARSRAASIRLRVWLDTSFRLIAREMVCRLTLLSDISCDWVHSMASNCLRRLSPYPGTTRMVRSLIVGSPCSRRCM